MQSQSQSTTSHSSFWAFLIGINEYRDEVVARNNLRGCVNDVEAMRIFLINQLGIPGDHIVVLTNQQATRANIIRTFQSFLIDNQAIDYGDQILFHFSGHGSQMPDPTGLEPDGYNETLVAHDSRTPDVFDIPDKTLAALLDLLAVRKGKRITVILDCCHSGSGTRRVEVPGMPVARFTPPEERFPPSDLDIDILSATSTRQAGLRSWASDELPYILLASCRDREVSYEYMGRSEDGKGSWYGALSYFTLHNLRQMVPGTTYKELHERVAARVNAIYRGQMPQCEGDREREVFGGAHVQRDPFIDVQRVQGNTVILAAGLVHGIHPGTEIALYPPEVRTHANLPDEPVATVNVISVSATTAQAHPVSVSVPIIPLHARGLITKQVYAGLRHTLSLRAAEGEENQQVIERLYEAIQKATPNKRPSPYLEMVDDSLRSADLYVVASGGKLGIYGADGELLIVPEEIQKQGQRDIIHVLHALECIVRYRRIVDLCNEDPGSQLAGLVNLGLRRYIDNFGKPYAAELPSTAIDSGGGLTINVDPEREEQNLYVVDVINKTSLWIYPHVFMLNPDYSIQRLYPQFGQQEALRSNRTLSIGLGSKDKPLNFYLPEQWHGSRDVIKIIATSEPCDLEWLEQNPIKVLPVSRSTVPSTSNALEKLLETILYEAGTRSMRLARTPQEDWATAELSIATVRTISHPL
jgi:Caspase domain